MSTVFYMKRGVGDDKMKLLLAMLFLRVFFLFRSLLSEE